ncbi:MAG: cytochrome c-type biogenesis protein CcmH [Proteobacteria bacterium]|nr:cytochrome c-type biogenesis protein CcmH [Pseudomonadota bacterium]
MLRGLGLLLCALVLLATPARAVQPDEVLANAALEARARELSRELRCMVCQNQSIDDSDAPLARDLRLLVRERLVHGDSDGQIIEFLVARYGEFVLLKPRFSWHTLVLWLAPALVLVAGAGTIAAVLRRRRARGDANAIDQAPPLTAQEQERLARLVGADNAG